MSEKTIGLHKLQVGDCARVFCLQNPPAMRRRLEELGLVEGTRVECIGKAPGGELFAYLIRGAVIALRTRDGRDVLVFPLGNREEELYGAD